MSDEPGLGNPILAEVASERNKIEIGSSARERVSGCVMDSGAPRSPGTFRERSGHLIDVHQRQEEAGDGVVSLIADDVELASVPIEVRGAQ